MFELGSKILEN